MRILLLAVGSLFFGSSTSVAQLAFGPRHVAISPALASQVALGDLDGDGDPDLFGRDGTAAFFSWNSGAGSFEDPTFLSELFPGYGDAELVDLDGDGDLDALSPPLVYRNDGAGGFQVLADFPAPAFEVIDYEVADFDGDGDLDLFQGTDDPVPFDTSSHLYLAGPGGYVDATSGLGTVTDGIRTICSTSGDVDDDGDVDLFLGQSLAGPFGPVALRDRLLSNDGVGPTFFSEEITAENGYTIEAELFDADGDGDLDLFLGSYESGVLYENESHGRAWTAGDPVPGGYYEVRIGDMDADGDLDLLTQDQWLVNESGTFAEKVPHPDPGRDARGLALGDVELDGDLDVVLAYTTHVYASENRNRLLLNDGHGHLLDATSALAHDTGFSKHGAFFDSNGDGFTDVVLAESPLLGATAAAPRLLVHDGSTGYTTTRFLPVSVENSTELVPGDVDGDGLLDLFVAVENGQSRLLGNVDGLEFTDETAALPQVAHATRRAALADVDGDGDTDVLLGNGAYPSTPADLNSLWLNDGSGTFADATPQLGEDSSVDQISTDALGLVDLDGDGDLDAFFGARLGTPRIFENDGSGTFSPAPQRLPTATSIAGVSEIGFGDLDLDGHLDAFYVALVPTPVPSDALWNDGTGTLVPGMPSPGLEYLLARSMALADADMDGDLDVFNAPGSRRLLRNNGDRTFVAETTLGSDLGLFVRVADVEGDGDVDLLTDLIGFERIQFGLTRHLSWRSLPRLGAPLVMAIDGTPGGAWTLACSSGEGELVLPPTGTLLLDPAFVSVVGMGVFDDEGRGRFETHVPTDPTLAGQSFYWQAGIGPPVRLSNRERTYLVDH